MGREKKRKESDEGLLSVYRFFSSTNFKSYSSSLFRLRSFLIPFSFYLSIRAFPDLVFLSHVVSSSSAFGGNVGVDVGESSGPASVGRSRIVNRDDPRILLSSRRQLRPCRSNSTAGDLGFHRRVRRSRECAILREKISPAISYKRMLVNSINSIFRSRSNFMPDDYSRF